MFVNENLKVVVLHRLTIRKPVHGKRMAASNKNCIIVVYLGEEIKIGIGEKVFLKVPREKQEVIRNKITKVWHVSHARSNYVAYKIIGIWQIDISNWGLPIF